MGLFCVLYFLYVISCLIPLFIYKGNLVTRQVAISYLRRDEVLYPYMVHQTGMSSTSEDYSESLSWLRQIEGREGLTSPRTVTEVKVLLVTLVGKIPEFQNIFTTFLAYPPTRVQTARLRDRVNFFCKCVNSIDITVPILRACCCGI